jgi:hypothetical protein
MVGAARASLPVARHSEMGALIPEKIAQHEE